MGMTEKIERVVINNMRYYKVTRLSDGRVLGIFPSVTSVLGATANKFFLKKWEKKIGEDNAKKITENAGKRGTVMHRLCEIYLGLPFDTDKKDRLEQTLTQSITDKEILAHDSRAVIIGGMLFYNFIRSNTFDIIKETVITEQFLWADIDGGYAGTVDNVSILVEGEIYCIIDFKTALKPKDENWIEDYKLQVSAYWRAVKERLGITAKKAKIMISNELQLQPQIFTLEVEDLRENYKKWKERLAQFYEKFPPISLELLNGEDELFNF